MTKFDAPGALYTYPTTINPVGVTTGYYVDASNRTHGFVRSHNLR
jgi:hypothetical protein